MKKILLSMTVVMLSLGLFGCDMDDDEPMDDNVAEDTIDDSDNMGIGEDSTLNDNGDTRDSEMSDLERTPDTN